jgi:hypothetical protein
MKNIIKNVLFRHKDNQPNLASESCRDLIATEIVAVVLSELSDDGKNRNPNQMELNFND